MDEVRPLFVGKRLLVVDDEALHRMVVWSFLEPLQVGIDEAGNGKEAIERVWDTQYDLILMNLNMPKLNGYEATERLRARDGGRQGRTTPIVAYTSEPPYIAQGKTEKVGMQGLLPKPCTRPDLIVAVGDSLQQSPLSPPQACAGKAVLVVDDSELNRLILNTDTGKRGHRGVGGGSVGGGHRGAGGAPLPIIGLSGESEEEQIRAARAAGMDDYLVKPIKQAILLQKVGEWLSSSPVPGADKS